MAGLVIILIVVAVIGSMGFAFYMYNTYQPNLITGTEGDTITVGPVEYVITFEGTHSGVERKPTNDTFVMIGITAKNIGSEDTPLSGGQFILTNGTKNFVASYLELSENDLLFERIEPNKPVLRTTQFNVSFNEDTQYHVIIKPQKEQASTDRARICITNC